MAKLFCGSRLWSLCLVLVIVVAAVQQAQAVRRLDPGVLDQCKRPGGPHRGCHPDPKAPPSPANKYNRGCSKIHRCRQG